MYLFSVFANRCVDAKRKAGAQKNQHEWVYEVPHMPDFARDTLKRIVEREEVGKLKRMMTQIGEKCQKILMDAFYYGYQPVEIAKRNGLKNPQSLAVVKARCLAKLRGIAAKKQHKA